MKRRSNTKAPHDPHVLYLDEDVSGKVFASYLTEANLVVRQYETLLRKKSKTPDSTVIEQASKANWVLVTTDKRMESEWTDDIIACRAKVILLTDSQGGPINWAAALICGRTAWVRTLLDHPTEPLTMKVNSGGSVIKFAGAEELIKRRDRILTSAIIRSKKHSDWKA